MPEPSFCSLPITQHPEFLKNNKSVHWMSVDSLQNLLGVGPSCHNNIEGVTNIVAFGGGLRNPCPDSCGGRRLYTFLKLERCNSLQFPTDTQGSKNQCYCRIPWHCGGKNSDSADPISPAPGVWMCCGIRSKIILAAEALISTTFHFQRKTSNFSFANKHIVNTTFSYKLFVFGARRLR